MKRGEGGGGAIKRTHTNHADFDVFYGVNLRFTSVTVVQIQTYPANVRYF